MGKRAQTFVGDCILAGTVIQQNLRFSNFIVEGNCIDLMIAIVRIVCKSFRIIGGDVGNKRGGGVSYKVGMKALCGEGRSG